ncbi:MAG: LacI family transcriptional regulator [Deltaproteobacteria bacterium]|nr:LacI family transcriptional regulator [Deltaproteobacteria bacterium]MBM4347056.1 LacI family transcriptional regulator [Deltaproteobacteria bacterium]
MMNKKVNIKDIARLANVSHTTVSRALNNKSRIRKETREKILSIAKELGYRPNFVARSLVMKRTKTLGLVITNIANPFYTELAQGIEKTATKLGYSIILCSTQSDISTEKQYIEMLRSKGVDGIIFSSAHMEDPNIVELAEEEFPIILVNRRTYHPTVKEKIDYVGVDNLHGGFLAVEHLIRLGHKRIGVIGGSVESSVGLERLEGGKKALQAYGLEQRNDYFLEGNFLKRSGYHRGKEFLKMAVMPTAIFATNDYMALGVYQALLEERIRIPEDVALVGFNDIEFSSMKGIELTTIGQKKFEMGAIAVEMLVDRIEKKDDKLSGREVFLEPELIIRKTCGFYLKKYQREPHKP